MHPLTNRDQIPPSPGSGLPPPPGFAGDIAKFVFQILERQVPEVAILVALGLLAGICGKAFKVLQHGLNIRIVFIAEDCVAEDALERGIESIISTVSKSYPEITRFVDPDKYSSGPALTKALTESPSFLNLVGDIGSNLEGMATTRNDRMAALHDATQPHNWSGYSLISRTSPNRLRKTLTAPVLGGDFIHEFTFVECSPVRPTRNELTDHDIPDFLRHRIGDLCKVATGNRASYSPAPVGFDAEASLFLDTFNNFCDSVINSSNDDVTHRIWNNAHEKALRVAALLAAADDCRLPIIKLQHAEWARDLVLHSIAAASRHNGGPHKPSKKRAMRR